MSLPPPLNESQISTISPILSGILSGCGVDGAYVEHYLVSLSPLAKGTFVDVYASDIEGAPVTKIASSQQLGHLEQYRLGAEEFPIRYGCQPLNASQSVVLEERALVLENFLEERGFNFKQIHTIANACADILNNSSHFRNTGLMLTDIGEQNIGICIRDNSTRFSLVCLDSGALQIENGQQYKRGFLFGRENVAEFNVAAAQAVENLLGVLLSDYDRSVKSPEVAEAYNELLDVARDVKTTRPKASLFDQPDMTVAPARDNGEKIRS
ncbi:MAG: hypothetical protein J0L97_03790 [Alphaproteobacteria bacterium]|nr:hypothetical protein [Alphaproteobacteria bacterium]